MQRKNTMVQRGFTLIELAIVLVIIGLIVGGVLVGQNLVAAAGVRATVSQIEKYNSAVNTFRGKYGALPGDLNAQVANTFGFVSRGQYAGEGDGNGIIEGIYTNAANSNCGSCIPEGETAEFWVDLSQVNLIDGSFTTGSLTATPTSQNVSLYFPEAKIGRGNYIYVWSKGGLNATQYADGVNYFGISAVTHFNGWPAVTSPALTVQEAYSIDQKVDDGLPQSGNVVAGYVANSFGNPDYGWAGGAYPLTPYTTATAGSSTSCFDNSSTTNGTPGVAGAAQHYSLEISGGNNVTCALSFRMQGGD